MIDVAIGLVLVFALTSLVVTTLHESWASFFDKRGKNLNLAIESLVGDSPEFAKSITDHPLIVSMSFRPENKERNPSYLSSDVFVSTLVARLSELYAGSKRPDSPVALIDAIKTGVLTSAAAPKQLPNSHLVKSLSSLAIGAEQDWPAYERRLCAWYDAVGERSIGWFKRDTQRRLFIIGFLVAAVLNVNPIVIASRLWKDEPLRKAMVTAGEQASMAYAASTAASGASSAVAPATPPASAAQPKTTSAARQPLQVEVDNSLDKLKESLFTAAESRSRPRTTETSQSLEQNIRETLDLKKFIDMRRDVASKGELQTLVDTNVSIERRIATISERLEKLPTSTDYAISRTALEALKKDLDNEKKRLSGSIFNTQTCRYITDENAHRLCQQLDSLDKLSSAGLPIGWSWANWPGCENGDCAARTPPTRINPLIAAPSGAASSSSPQLISPSEPPIGFGAVNACTADANCAMGLSIAVLGWVITAWATMLGAPFWFDFLGKLVKLRGSGAKPENASKENGTGGGTSSPSGSLGGTLTPPSTPLGSGDASTINASEPSRDVLMAAEAALDTATVRRVQEKVGLSGGAITGFFDRDTRVAIEQWQSVKKLPQTGTLTETQIKLLLEPPPVAVAPPVVFSPPLPPRQQDRILPPSILSVRRRLIGTTLPLSEQQVRDKYGDITTVPVPGANGAVGITRTGKQGGVQHQLVPFNHVVLSSIGVNNLEVHALALQAFTNVFNAIQAQGFGGEILSCAGTYVPRHIGSDVNKPLSRHTWGIAIDLNSTQNGLNVQPAAPGTAGHLYNIAPIFINHGFAWGGQFSSPLDGMHFELALL